MPKTAPQPAPKFAVLVSGPTQAALRRFLALHVKPHFGLHKTQWRARYRDEYALTVLSRVLRQGPGSGQSAAGFYGPHAGAAVLVLAALDQGAPGSGFAAARDWCKASGFDPVAWVSVPLGGPEYEVIEQGLEIVRFVNQRCPWQNDAIEDLDAYVAKSGRTIW